MNRAMTSRFAAVLVAIGVLYPCNIAVAQISTPKRTRSENRSELPITAFYQTPAPLPDAKPGTLIRSEAFDDYDLSADISALRILYHSRSASGKDTATSGVILIPEGKPPAGGWPVIAWAHGFTGVARRCAPSLMRNVFNGPFFSMYLTLGYAIVVADYGGLGTDSRYAVLDGQSNAADVIYAISAAHAATPVLGSKWIAMGESQGGLVALAVAELPETRDPNYLGSVAISRIATLKDLYGDATQSSSTGMLAVLAYGIKSVYAEFKIEDLLTNAGLGMLAQIESTCGVPDIAGAEGGTARSDWVKNHFVQQFFARNEIGQRPAHGPLLVIVSATDTLVTVSMTSQAIAQLCRQGDHVEFEKYPELDAGSVLGASIRDQITWIQARFAGRQEVTNCP